MNRLLLILALWSSSCAFAHAQTKAVPAPAGPTLSYILPSAVQPGATTDIRLIGAELSGATGLWSSLPCESVLKQEANKGADAGRADFRLSVPAGAPLGVMAVRVATAGGMSNPRLLLVDDLPTVNEVNANKTLATAQVIQPPVAIDGACDAQTSDFFAFDAVAGQSLSVEVVARRIGYPLDPQIRLLDAAGQELAFSDDDPAIGVDCRFAYRFAAAGRYCLELRDVRYEGSTLYRYRLRVGDFPLATAAYPLAIPKGTATGVQALTAGGDLPAPIVVVAPAQTSERIQATLPGPSVKASSWLTVAIADAPDQLELEPNDRPETATKCVFPGAFEGRLAAARDRDYFEFAAKKGQRLLLSGQTRSLGSPTDLLLRLYDAAGTRVAEAEDNAGEEGAIDFVVPADGVYRLRAEDVNERGGPEHVYRVVAELFQPGFTLTLDANTFNVPQAGVFSAKVTCVRRDYDGPIALSLDGASEDFELQNNVIGVGKKDAVLTATLPVSWKAGQWTACRLVGRAKIGEREFTSTASTLAVLRKSLSGLPYPPAELDGALSIGVGPVFPDFFKLAADPPVVPFVAPQGPATFKIKTTRQTGFDGRIELAVEGLPPGVAVTIRPIEKKENEATIEFSAKQKVAPGRYPLKLYGSSVFQDQPKRIELEGVALEVTAAGAKPAAKK